MPWWRNKNLQLRDIDLDGGKIRIVREIAKNRTERQPRLMALADWGMRQLLLRAQALGATEPQHYLLPLSLTRSRSAKDKNQKFDVNRPMTGWVKSWPEAHPEVQYGWIPLPRSPAHLPDFRGGGWCPARSDDGAARTHGPGNVSRIRPYSTTGAWACQTIDRSEQAPVLAAAQRSSGAADGSATPKV